MEKERWLPLRYRDDPHVYHTAGMLLSSHTDCERNLYASEILIKLKGILIVLVLLSYLLCSHEMCLPTESIAASRIAFILSSTVTMTP
jgi:hypothetical protein